jgi:hypothetical protein
MVTALRARIASYGLGNQGAVSSMILGALFAYGLMVSEAVAQGVTSDFDESVEKFVAEVTQSGDTSMPTGSGCREGEQSKTVSIKAFTKACDGSFIECSKPENPTSVNETKMYPCNKTALEQKLDVTCPDGEQLLARLANGQYTYSCPSGGHGTIEATYCYKCIPAPKLQPVAVTDEL